MSRAREIRNNHTIKRGLVVERDGANQRVRVRFPDEDETTSYWIDVISKGSTANADYDMPDENDEVWCGLDPSGEGGCLLGTRYNGKDRPNESDPDKKRRDFKDGSAITHDPATGTHVMNISGTLILKVGGSTITMTPGGIVLEAARIDLNRCPPPPASTTSAPAMAAGRRAPTPRAALTCSPTAGRSTATGTPGSRTPTRSSPKPTPACWAAARPPSSSTASGPAGSPDVFIGG